MTTRHNRMPSDADRETFSLAPGGLARAAPIMPQLGMPPMTREAKESKEQAQAWDASLNRIFQAMHGEDTAKYLAYFKARLEVEENYTRSLEKLGSIAKGGSKGSGPNTNNAGGINNAPGAGPGAQGSGNGVYSDPEEFPSTLQLAYDALLETTQQVYIRRRPFLRLLRNLTGALVGLKVHATTFSTCRFTLNPKSLLELNTHSSINLLNRKPTRSSARTTKSL